MKDCREEWYDPEQKVAVTIVDVTEAAQTLARAHLCGPTSAHYLTKALAAVALLGAENAGGSDLGYRKILVVVLRGDKRLRDRGGLIGDGRQVGVAVLGKRKIVVKAIAIFLLHGLRGHLLQVEVAGFGLGIHDSAVLRKQSGYLAVVEHLDFIAILNRLLGGFGKIHVVQLWLPDLLRSPCRGLLGR